MISVDANELSNEIQTNKGYSDGAQLAWLERTLKRWRTDADEAHEHRLRRRLLPPLRLLDDQQPRLRRRAARRARPALLAATRSTWSCRGTTTCSSGPTRSSTASRPVRRPTARSCSPQVDGVTYICVGSGGRPRYPFRPAPSADAPAPAGSTPTGPQALPEGQRYRGYAPPGGENSAENNTENVVNSYYWSADGTAKNASGYLQGTKVPEVVGWSQVRYDAYAFLADRREAGPARASTRPSPSARSPTRCPGTNEAYSEIDRITLQRRAGEGRIRRLATAVPTDPTP